MLAVGRKPVVQYVVEELVAAGMDRVLFITGPGKASIENHFDLDAELISYLRGSGREDLLESLEFEREQVEYFYTRQREQLGLGHAVLCAEAMVGDQPFLVALGDSIIGLHAQSEVVSRMVGEFEKTDVDMVVCFEEVPRKDVVRYGIAAPKGATGEVFELADLIEKPAVDEAPSNLAVAARYVFSSKIFAALHKTQPGKGGEIQLTDAIRILLRDGCRGLGVRLAANEQRYDIGNFESYFRAFSEFALSDPQFGPGLRQHLKTLPCWNEDD